VRITDAIITARGGSKRIPRKNVLDICGIPLIAWSIIQAKTAKQITRVWVSTDDDEIADVSEHFGARVIRRPEWMWDDKYGASVPLLHALRHIRDMGLAMDLFVHMFPTNPLRRPGDLNALLGAYQNVPKPEAPIMLTSNHGIPMHHLAVWWDRGNGIAEMGFMDKTGTALLYAGGCAAWQVDDFFHMERLVSDWYGGERRTDKGTDERMNAGMEGYPPKKLTVIAWTPMQWWQIHKLDLPSEIEIVQKLMEQYILKGKGVDVYGSYQERT